MKKYTVLAYEEDGYPRQSATIEAENRTQAQRKAWEMFPEYHEVGVFEKVEPKPTPRGMKVLVACEESQAVTKELRQLGHEAYSCDIIDQSGGHPEWHIKGDALPLLDGDCRFTTTDGQVHRIPEKWDMLIAFPPCTHLAVSGARHFEVKRADGRQREGVDFFCKFLTADCDRIAIENQVNIISGEYVKKWFPDLAEKYGLPLKPSQAIQPWQFGHEASKKTCLWLKGLPPLAPTNIVDRGEFVTTGKDNKQYTAWLAWSKDENGKTISWKDPRTAALRSKTFPGVAKAMAEQWAGPCESMNITEEEDAWML